MCDVEEARQGLGFTLLIFPVGGMTVPPSSAVVRVTWEPRGRAFPAERRGTGSTPCTGGGRRVRAWPLSFSILALLPTKQSIS